MGLAVVKFVEDIPCVVLSLALESDLAPTARRSRFVAAPEQSSRPVLILHVLAESRCPILWTNTTLLSIISVMARSYQRPFPSVEKQMHALGQRLKVIGFVGRSRHLARGTDGSITRSPISIGRRGMNYRFRYLYAGLRALGIDGDIDAVARRQTGPRIKDQTLLAKHSSSRMSPEGNRQARPTTKQVLSLSLSPRLVRRPVTPLKSSSIASELGELQKVGTLYRIGFSKTSLHPSNTSEWRKSDKPSCSIRGLESSRRHIPRPAQPRLVFVMDSARGRVGAGSHRATGSSGGQARRSQGARSTGLDFPPRRA